MRGCGAAGSEVMGAGLTERGMSVGSEVTAGCVWGQDMRGLSYQIRSMLDLEGAWRAH